MFGAQPLKSDIGVVKCDECDKPVLRSAMGDHAGEYTAILCSIGGVVDTFMQTIANLSDLGERKAPKAKAQM